MDFTILHFAIHIVWRANVICTYRKSGIARKMTIAYPELRLLRTPNILRTIIARDSPDVYLLLMYMARKDMESLINLSACEIKA